MQPKTCAARAAALLAAALLCAAPPAGAQIGVPAARAREFHPRIGVGYVANVPNQFAGASAHVLTDFLGGTGLYVDFKFDLAGPADEEGYIDSLTVARVEETRSDQFFREGATWTSVNVALMKSVGPQFAVYGGAGWSNGRQYAEYVDRDRELGRLGFYWVRDEERSGAQVNVLGGAFFQLTEAFAFQVGAESAPRGITMGASYLVPLRRR